MASDLRVQCPRVGARGQNLEHLRIFFVAFNFLLWISFVYVPLKALFLVIIRKRSHAIFS